MREILIRGWENCFNKPKREREPITLKSLSNIKHKILGSKNSERKNLAFWMACSVAFFGCLRMGEVLNLKNNDVKKGKKHFILSVRGKCSKEGERDQILMFPFPIKRLCPYTALKRFIKSKEKNELKNNKKFLSSNTKMLISKREINKFLKNKFPKKHFSCHSFRAGVPSSISNFPEIVNVYHVMGWGRWRTEAFLSYQKFKFRQKKWVFRKICKALLEECK